MGNPHAVLFVKDAEAVDLEREGRAREISAVFPQRANIEFVHVIDRSTVRARVWERGAGITLACGSGACAVAVAAIRKGLTERTVTVKMDGGDLRLEWREADGHVYMTGAASLAFRGTLL
jgi:diaminopimelate epimerase